MKNSSGSRRDEHFVLAPRGPARVKEIRPSPWWSTVCQPRYCPPPRLVVLVARESHSGSSRQISVSRSSEAAASASTICRSIGHSFVGSTAEVNSPTRRRSSAACGSEEPDLDPAEIVSCTNTERCLADRAVSSVIAMAVTPAHGGPTRHHGEQLVDRLPLALSHHLDRPVAAIANRPPVRPAGEPSADTSLGRTRPAHAPTRPPDIAPRSRPDHRPDPPPAGNRSRSCRGTAVELQDAGQMGRSPWSISSRRTTVSADRTPSICCSS